jgi:hypothetical protein
LKISYFTTTFSYKESFWSVKGLNKTSQLHIFVGLLRIDFRVIHIFEKRTAPRSSEKPVIEIILKYAQTMYVR